MNEENIIEAVLYFAKQFIHAGRGKDWKLYKLNTNTSPLWCCDEELPSIDIIKREGMNCAGLINLMRRKAGLSVLVLKPDRKNVLGGTDDWFKYLNSKDRLQPFDIKASYPRGTMLLRDYNFIDEGHLAVIYKRSEQGVLVSSVIHSDGYSRNKVVIDTCVGKSHFAQRNGTTNTGHYTHICLPENWLLR